MGDDQFQRHFILATAGHVDHGKSALVKALTGTDPDRLPEEKTRGITIDLGFAHLDLADPGRSPDAGADSGGGGGAGAAAYHLGIVDVPGHEDFVKNMVAGVGSIDLALLIVAADDGWMPQTEEHIQIVNYLGVRRAVVALTKIDLAEGLEAEVEAGVRERLQGTPFADAPIVGTSVVTGHGVEALKSALRTVLNSMTPPRDLGKPRLPVDRVFTLQGIGTVVTGTLTGGVLERGQAVVLQPGGRVTRARALQNHHRDAARCGPGTRTAVNVPDLAAATRGKGHAGGSGDADRIQRGDVITIPELGHATDTVDVLLAKSARLTGLKTPASRPLKDGALVRIHHGSGNAPARVMLLNARQLEPGGEALAQLRLERPLFMLGGDRFIVRDWAEQWTLGGGKVLDADAGRDQIRSASRLEFLESRARDAGAAAWLGAQLRRDRAVRGGASLVRTTYGAEEVTAAARELAGGGRLLDLGEWWLDKVWWEGVRTEAEAAIGAEHRAHPERPGLGLNELRALMTARLPVPELFGVLMADLGARGYRQVGTAVRHGTHRPSLPPQLQAAGARLREALGAKPMEPPSRKELLAVPQGAQALRFLIETGEVADLGPEAVIGSEAFARAVAMIKAYLQSKGHATASELRQVLGTNRRVIIPLLERLDKDGVTLRQGDTRVLRKVSPTGGGSVVGAP